MFRGNNHRDTIIDLSGVRWYILGENDISQIAYTITPDGVVVWRRRSHSNWDQLQAFEIQARLLSVPYPSLGGDCIYIPDYGNTLVYYHKELGWKGIKQHVVAYENLFRVLYPVVAVNLISLKYCAISEEDVVTCINFSDAKVGVGEVRRLFAKPKEYMRHVRNGLANSWRCFYEENFVKIDEAQDDAESNGFPPVFRPGRELDFLENLPKGEKS